MIIESNVHKERTVHWTIFGMLLNIISSTGTITMNKILFQQFNFKNLGTFLTVLHFFFSFICTLLLAHFKFFKVKILKITSVLPICFAFCGYVVFNNISLAHNSVSFYQIMKIMCTPTIILIQYFVYQSFTKFRVILSLIPICVGSIISAFTDIEINWYGSLMALLAVISNSMYTIYGNTKQKELGVKSLQLLLYQSILSGLILSPMILIFDNVEDLINFNWNIMSITYILISCLLAYFVNLSFFLVVGRTSPLTMNVLGYVKTIVVFVIAFTMFTTVVDFQNLIGIVLTLIGVGWYSYEKM
ncbi:hypothetical protein ABK040_012732 [Willaertia magna]